MKETTKQISPHYDPWEAYMDIEEFGKPILSNIEVTTTNLCNMRCGHCAVGYTLQPKDPDPLPLSLMIKRLDEIPHLRSFSITGGEPMLSMKSIERDVIPLLKYAHERGAHTQINSNLTLDLDRYNKIIPYLDVLHISHNWGTAEEFSEFGFAMMDRKPTLKQASYYLDRMIDNAKQLSKEGVFVSAETMLNKRTLPYLKHIYEQIIEMGCHRYEIHPMYPSDFASKLDTLSLDEIRKAIHYLLEIRDPNHWMLFGTLPFYACSSNSDDLTLLSKLYQAKNVTVRNDPDGRSRLNVNIFTGEIIVTDFGDIPVLGNIQEHSFQEAYQTWLNTTVAKSISCHCPNVKCLGPNILVKDKYYPSTDFQKRKAPILQP